MLARGRRRGRVGAGELAWARIEGVCWRLGEVGGGEREGGRGRDR